MMILMDFGNKNTKGSPIVWWSMIMRLELDLGLIDVTDQKFDFPRTFTT